MEAVQAYIDRIEGAGGRYNAFLRVGLDTAIHLLLDASSSMRGEPIRLVSLSAYSLCEALGSVPGISVGATVFPGGRVSKRLHGKPLTGTKKGLWRYRIGDYRLIAHIKDHELIILCINIGHRREIYK